MIGRLMTFLYGMVCYVVFFAVFLYAIAFLGDFGVPKTMNSGKSGSVLAALAIDATLLGLFGLQHSVMARPWFKRAWTRVIPPSAERSTYVLFSSLALALLFLEWRPIGGVVWDVSGAATRSAIYAIYGAGWVLLLISTFLINHFDLFGLRQVYLHLRGRNYSKLQFRTPGFYRLVRHPIYFSWLCIFWATPQMTIAHLVFALGTTGYILLAIPWEESDLIRAHGEAYRRYRQQVPAILPVRLAQTKPALESASGTVEYQ